MIPVEVVVFQKESNGSSCVAIWYVFLRSYLDQLVHRLLTAVLTIDILLQIPDNGNTNYAFEGRGARDVVE